MITVGRKGIGSLARRMVLGSVSCFCPALASAGPDVLTQLDRCNVVWDSPSRDSMGSMPLGNGDIGLNVWVEESGDLLFYVSKVDAFDASHALRKLGRVRVKFDPPLAVTNGFRQELKLIDGAVEIQSGTAGRQSRILVWVDANNPVIRVTGTSVSPVEAVAGFETLRDCAEQDDKADRLAWCYRNASSIWIDRVRSQNTPEFAAAAAAADPIMNRTSGCRMSGEGFVRDSKRSLRMKASRTLNISIRVLSSQAATLPEWFAELDKPAVSDWKAHQAWWKAFWARSHIFVGACGSGAYNLDQCRFAQVPQGSKAYEGHKEIDVAKNASQLTQRYALERFCEAAAGRGVVPPPFNGSIFTMDMPAGVASWGGPRPNAVSADSRDWEGLPFMWQNTRLPYWAMAARGDYDTMLPGMKFVRDGLDVCRDRSRHIFKHDGAFIMEASLWRNVGVFNWDGMPGHLRYHFLASIELPAIMCEYYEHTGDRKFLDEILLPCADEFIKFYELQFPRRDARGKMVMEPAATVETYQPVTNPNTEVTGLRFLLAKLLSFEVGPGRQKHWSKLRGELPEVPTRRIKGLDLLAVGEKYAPGREICESPEMYSVYPFRQAWLGNPALLAGARQSLHLRTVSIDGTADGQAVETGGWQTAPVQAAYLGLPREAARLASINFNDQFVSILENVDPPAPIQTRPRARFPVFWETKMDYTPDNDHGANCVNALQSMLLQSDGKKIYLLPAWPEDWDVSFKLHASFNTTVECEYANGRVKSLKVTPVSRRDDVVDMSSLENRIRTLVSVACSDRNYLFGLAPMLDGLPVPGKTTGPWLAKYGESVTGVRAGPWPHCVFKGNIVYVHMLDGPVEPPAIPAKLVSSKYLTGRNEKPDTILRLEYDRSVEEFALAAPSRDSFTAGMSGKTVDLGQPRTFDRLEFTIENPGHRRGHGRPFELQMKQDDGSWRTVHSGQVFGSIYSKRFDPVTARHVRLNVDTPIRQFDLFPAGK